MTLRKGFVALLPALIAVGNADVAHAAMTDCSLVDGQGKVTLDNAAGTATFTATPIYITGSTALEPLSKAAGPTLAGLATNPYVIIYAKDGSCAGVNRIIGDGKIAATVSLFYVPPDADGTTSKACGASSQAVDGTMVLSDVDATLCPGVTTQPPGTVDFHGPVNNMVFVAPPTSTVRGISAEMGYLMFGLGADGGATPYTDPTAYFIRTPDSGTRAMINAALGLTTHNWQGDAGVTASKPGGYGSGDVFNKVAGAAQTAPDKTIGILGEDFYDSSSGGVANRNQVKALAFRAFKQQLAYWPDSTLTSRDKKNVREGRYGIWGFVHMIAKVTGATATNPSAQYFIDFVQGNLASSPVSALDLTISSHLTPVCAMKVTHDIEGAPSKPYTDAAPCGCYFETKATGTTPATCKACTADGDCAGNANGTHCRHGYCEAN